MGKADNLDILKEKIERVVGRKMQTPRDFDYLAANIFNNTRQMVSSTTLKRFWGYMHEKKEVQSPHKYTLNILAEFAGYINYDTFCKECKQMGTLQSDFLFNNFLQVNTLVKGQQLLLMWQPNRKITIQYMGMCMFKVTDSKNSKLSVGDIFICEQIIDNESLILRNLIHENGEPVNYICGRIGGIRFKLIKEDRNE